LTTEVFEGLLKTSTSLKATSPMESIAPMTCEEESAIRYIEGYMVTTLSHKFKREKTKKCELEALQELRGDETELAEESEEWSTSVDR
jgi:hypothetical protein